MGNIFQDGFGNGFDYEYPELKLYQDLEKELTLENLPINEDIFDMRLFEI